ncbi:hypothetical protein DPEC_G00270220 [Dallia pectoralis]|uniref:Uncharacterized protein n=1 Tax=Dallia pectoralis TaxID=75939 RepID=A0ACC2FPE5_DALPE|nr:hypothetical protein DPEC_G00270220 [Dallia pectoralis]
MSHKALCCGRSRDKGAAFKQPKPDQNQVGMSSAGPRQDNLSAQMSVVFSQAGDLGFTTWDQGLRSPVWLQCGPQRLSRALTESRGATHHLLMSPRRRSHLLTKTLPPLASYYS